MTQLEMNRCKLILSIFILDIFSCYVQAIPPRIIERHPNVTSHPSHVFINRGHYDATHAHKSNIQRLAPLKKMAPSATMNKSSMCHYEWHGSVKHKICTF